MENMSFKIISLNKIDSTQLYAQNLVAKNQVSDKTAIVADMQTAGRGRYRRVWDSPAGNLYASFIFKTAARDPKLSYAVAVAVAETFIAVGVNPQIKWPNDILIDGKKISGILIEYAKDFVIVGIGINIKSNPVVENYETTKLQNYSDVGRDELFGIMVKNLDVWIGRDFANVRKRWTDFAAGLNKIIKYRGRDVEMIGINEDGALVLRRGADYMLTYGDEISI